MCTFVIWPIILILALSALFASVSRVAMITEYRAFLCVIAKSITKSTSHTFIPLIRILLIIIYVISYRILNLILIYIYISFLGWCIILLCLIFRISLVLIINLFYRILIVSVLIWRISINCVIFHFLVCRLVDIVTLYNTLILKCYIHYFKLIIYLSFVFFLFFNKSIKKYVRCMIVLFNKQWFKGLCCLIIAKHTVHDSNVMWFYISVLWSNKWDNVFVMVRLYKYINSIYIYVLYFFTESMYFNFFLLVFWHLFKC